MFKAVVGQSEGTDTLKVSQAVIAQCQGQLNRLSPAAGILFAADHFDHVLVIKEITSYFPGIELAGCTSSGEMSSIMGFSQDSMCLMLFASDTIAMASGIGFNLSAAPGKAVHQAVKDACSRLNEDPSLCFIFPGILSTGIETVLAEVYKVLAPSCKVFGGVPGSDEFSNNKILQFTRDSVSSDAVAVLLFAGPVRIASVICNSWKPVGYRSVVNETDGNRVLRIGDRSALQFFREAFGPYAVPLPEMPLAIFDENERYYLRSAYSFDENEESIEYATPIPKGQRIQLTEATPESIRTDLKNCFQNLLQGVNRDWSPEVALLFSCASRRWIMGLRTSEEITLAASTLPDNIPIAGFYTFGEIAPIVEYKTPKLHNCTLVTVLIGEEKSDADAPARTAPYIVSDEEPNQNVELLAKKLDRARESQARLELQKESFTNVLRKMSEDLVQAKQRIEEQNQILKESLTLAQEVQQSLLPIEAPLVDGFEVAGRSLYCDETGGDYIDYLPGENGLAVVVGDVSGHGVAAALLMTTARALLRMRSDFGGSPAQLVTHLNRSLTSDVQNSGRFMTLIYLWLDSYKHTVTWVRAGHEPGLRYTPETGEFSKLMGEGLALGVLDNVTYNEYTTSPLDAGEIVIIGTDGITETRDTQGRLFGQQRLMELVRNKADCSASKILNACLLEVQNFRAGLQREDDETLVVIKAK